jgi:hypothetical protein
MIPPPDVVITVRVNTPTSPGGRACTAVSAPLSPNTKAPVGSSASGGGSVVMRGVYPVRGSGSQAGEYQPDWNANEKDEDQQPVAVQAPLSGAGDWPYPSRAQAAGQ